MFICALQTYAVVIIIAVIAVQYAFALFCLLKLAYLDITKKEYVLWNLFILIVFFIGGIAFLVYYSKVKDTKSIKPAATAPENTDGTETDARADAGDAVETENVDVSDSVADEGEEPKE